MEAAIRQDRQVGSGGVPLLAAFLVLVAYTGCLSQTVSFARWRNGATAAHSIVHDDFGESWFGNINVMDSLAYNRQICVTFGTIALRSSAPWARARALFARGHRFVSHSGTHIMSDGLDWDLAQEIDSSRAVIERNVPGNSVLFFCAPGDNRLAASVKDYIRSHGWIGIRGGCWQANSYAVADPFSTCLLCYSGGGVAELDQDLDNAISQGNWLLRETHQVGTTGGYYPVSDQAIWRAYLDSCVAKRLSGALWTAPVQEVLMYALERSRWSVSVTSSSATQLQITIDNDSVINQYVDNHTFDVPLTLTVGLPGGWTASEAQVAQNGLVIPHTVVSAGTIRFDAAPWDGVVTVYSSPTVAVAQPLRVVQPGARRAWPGGTLFGLDGRMAGIGEPGAAAVRVAAPNGRAGVVRLDLTTGR